MRNKDWKTNIAHEALIILGVLALLTFICRLWPILLLIILGIFIAALRLLFLSAKKTKEVPQPEPVTEPEREPTEKDMLDMAYGLILKRITELVTDEYPNARWIWAQPNAKRMIQNDEDVFVLLNHAGGYARAKVCIHNLRATGLQYLSAPAGNEKKSESDNSTETDYESDAPEPKPENYELIAFQWVDAHALDLNNRCNEEIGQGNDVLILHADELPVPESWADICVELKRVGLADAECIDFGIKINLTQ